MSNLSYVIDTRTGVKRRLMPGDAMRDGEVMYMPMEGMHRAATLKLSDAGVAAFIRDGATDGEPAGFFRDGYGRLLPTGTTSGNDRTDGKALGYRLAYEADLRDAWRHVDAEPDAPQSREQYVADLANAWRQP